MPDPAARAVLVWLSFRCNRLLPVAGLFQLSIASYATRFSAFLEMKQAPGLFQSSSPYTGIPHFMQFNHLTAPNTMMTKPKKGNGDNASRSILTHTSCPPFAFDLPVVREPLRSPSHHPRRRVPSYRDDHEGVQGSPGADPPPGEGDAYGTCHYPQLVLPSPRRLSQGAGAARELQVDHIEWLSWSLGLSLSVHPEESRKQVYCLHHMSGVLGVWWAIQYDPDGNPEASL